MVSSWQIKLSVVVVGVSARLNYQFLNDKLFETLKDNNVTLTVFNLDFSAIYHYERTIKQTYISWRIHLDSTP